MYKIAEIKFKVSPGIQFVWKGQGIGEGSVRERPGYVIPNHTHHSGWNKDKGQLNSHC